jgi:ribosome-binding protein aMBF1 (putative translation factor)
VDRKRVSWRELRERDMTSPAFRDAYEKAGRAIELGEKVRRLREARGWSQAELGQRMGASQPFIARLELGGVQPTIPTLERVSAALGAELIIDLQDLVVTC